MVLPSALYFLWVKSTGQCFGLSREVIEARHVVKTGNIVRLPADTVYRVLSSYDLRVDQCACESSWLSPESKGMRQFSKIQSVSVVADQ
jgi:hypothetical protein